MSEEYNAIITETGKLLFDCFYDLQRTVMEDWQSLQLSMAQLKVLLILSFKGPAAISKLAEILNISHPTVSQLVDRLVQAGYVERVEQATDRRVTLAHLTPAGEELAQHLWHGRMEHLHANLARLDEQDLIALHQGIRALSHVISSHSEPSEE